MYCWSSRSRFTLIVSDVALTGCVKAGATTWLLFLNTKSETLWSVILSFVLTVLHVNIPWLACNYKSRECCVTELASNGFSLAKNLMILVSVELLYLCWSHVLKSTDVNLGSVSLISAHAQWTFKMDHSIIHSILISTAALIHRTGTSIYTLIHGIATLIYTNSLKISFLALSSLYL